MDNPISSASEPPIKAQKPFDKWADCQKALKTLVPLLQEEERDRVVARIADSSHRHHIAFEILCSLHDPKQNSKPRWLEGPMLKVLSGGMEPPILSSLTIPSDAKKWVQNELQDIYRLAHWKEFVTSGRHFWVLYAILRTAPNTHVLIEALNAFSECAERCQNTDEFGKPKKRHIQASDGAWIVKLIKSKAPPKPELSKTFFETLFALNAAATLSESVRSESDGLRVRLKLTEDDLASEVQARANAEQRERDLKAELETTSQSLEATKNELSEEKLHTTRQGGFNTVAKRETINHVLSTVRQGITHRLENIRGYADREKPNREEILALVGEIEKHLSRLEEEVSQ
jgi:hypothetical protein